MKHDKKSQEPPQEPLKKGKKTLVLAAIDDLQTDEQLDAFISKLTGRPPHAG